ncbi:hypothetical protein QYE76_061412 [Lolium multiflorum]|uniref:Aldehyde oxidase/xanthine dehydrogenase second molybdopterin binding domain-containing protein n=1 Tax=Lolium multiflorum TaxID=4521 RepID=A0AAD8W7F8_LOLMU|nr:hypothetical protein QYE76_061412 [Lolium multiflorum]
MVLGAVLHEGDGLPATMKRRRRRGFVRHARLVDIHLPPPSLAEAGGSRPIGEMAGGAAPGFRPVRLLRRGRRGQGRSRHGDPDQGRAGCYRLSAVWLLLAAAASFQFRWRRRYTPRVLCKAVEGNSFQPRSWEAGRGKVSSLPAPTKATTSSTCVCKELLLEVLSPTFRSSYRRPPAQRASIGKIAVTERRWSCAAAVFKGNLSLGPGRRQGTAFHGCKGCLKRELLAGCLVDDFPEQLLPVSSPSCFCWQERRHRKESPAVETHLRRRQGVMLFLSSAHAYWTPDPAFVKYINYGAGVSEVEIDVLTGATTILRSDLLYDCGQSLNPAVDLGQVEGSFVQGVGFFTNEEYATNADGMVINDGTWTYKIPTVDTIPKQLNVELINRARDRKRVLSSKASGEPPLLLAASVHCAMREAIRAARTDFSADSPLTFQMDVPATMAHVKELCGLDVVERHLQSLSAAAAAAKA